MVVLCAGQPEGGEGKESVFVQDNEPWRVCVKLQLFGVMHVYVCVYMCTCV